LLGETGTGKELIAKAVHQLSARNSGPFVRVNCGALTESLLESELFGHVRGSFTGAVANRTGRFEAAHTGTIFLDEINSTTPMLQVKLLRVLQEREFERVGDTQTIRVDTRVIAASNRDLFDEVNEAKFREDLYYRLNVVSIYLPPLRQRREDIPELVSHFLARFAAERRMPSPSISDEAMAALQAHDWPGNVRQLRNIIERTIILAPGDRVSCIEVDLLPPEILDHQTAVGGSNSGMAIMGSPLREARESFEREYLKIQIRRFSGNISRTASFIGMERSALHRKLKALGIGDKREGDE
jgi:two-component system nitrogen regulation response regulator NtrX